MLIVVIALFIISLIISFATGLNLELAILLIISVPLCGLGVYAIINKIRQPKQKNKIEKEQEQNNSMKKFKSKWTITFIIMAAVTLSLFIFMCVNYLEIFMIAFMVFFVVLIVLIFVFAYSYDRKKREIQQKKVQYERNKIYNKETFKENFLDIGSKQILIAGNAIDKKLYIQLNENDYGQLIPYEDIRDIEIMFNISSKIETVTENPNIWGQAAATIFLNKCGVIPIVDLSDKTYNQEFHQTFLAIVITLKNKSPDFITLYSEGKEILTEQKEKYIANLLKQADNCVSEMKRCCKLTNIKKKRLRK